MITTLFMLSTWLGILGLSLWITLRFVRMMQSEPSAEVDDPGEPCPTPDPSAPRIIHAPAAKFRMACANCAAVFEYDMTHVYGTVSAVTCPSCKAKNWHFASNAVIP